MTATYYKILVAQVEAIPEEVNPGLSPTMAGPADTACQRLLADLQGNWSG